MTTVALVIFFQWVAWSYTYPAKWWSPIGARTVIRNNLNGFCCGNSDPVTFHSLVLLNFSNVTVYLCVCSAIPLVDCPQGYKRVNSSHCQGKISCFCLLPGYIWTTIGWIATRLGSLVHVLSITLYNMMILTDYCLSCSLITQCPNIAGEGDCVRKTSPKRLSSCASMLWISAAVQFHPFKSIS